MIEFKWHVPISTDELRGIFQDVCGWSPPDSFVSILADYNGSCSACSAISLIFKETDFGEFLDFHDPTVTEVWLGGGRLEKNFQTTFPLLVTVVEPPLT